MRTVVDGEAHVHYGQIYVHSEGGDPFEGDLTACFAGQRNGLCGAAFPGTLFLITGLHTGNVGFTAEVHDTGPPVPPLPPGSGWEDVVEASFHAAWRDPARHLGRRERVGPRTVTGRLPRALQRVPDGRGPRPRHPARRRTRAGPLPAPVLARATGA